jgi:2-phosphosulfolactate phosphatase
LDSADADVVASGVGECIKAGEYLAEDLPGFASPAPLRLGREPLRGKALVYCTTNGTVALRASSGASFAYAGALLNGAALVSHIVRTHPDSQVLIVCSGSVGNFNLEDFYGAGHFVEHFERLGNYQLNDAAHAAKLLRSGYDARTVLLSSRVGLMMLARGLGNEVEYCAQLDILNVVARLDGESVRNVQPS